MKIASNSGDRRLPLVSCIMPTKGRPDLVRQSVRYFQAQDYPSLELVVAYDDPADLPLLPSDPRIRAVRVEPGLSIGEKRNRACERARGEIVAHWDDDDWYSPARLSEQVAPLRSDRADVTGFGDTVFFELLRGRFWRTTDELHDRLFVGNVHGGTLVYRRDLWEKIARYPDLSLAEDAALLAAATRKGARLGRVRNDGHFLYLRHATNSWNFTCGEFPDRRGWRLLGENPLPVRDRAFYAARRRRTRATGPGTGGPPFPPPRPYRVPPAAPPGPPFPPPGPP